MGSISRIMIVEDEAITAMMMEYELNSYGFQVCKKAATGVKAIAAAESENPDLILMDIQLPGNMSGIEAAREILTKRDIPIIFITGYPDADIRDKAMQLKPAAYFIKPVRIHELKRIIDNINDSSHPL